MRMTSSDLSRRLCAFSVLRARICQATSCRGTTSAVSARAEPAHGLEAVAPVGRPEALLRRCDCDDRIEKHPGAVQHVGEPAMVHLRKVALERGRLDRIDRQHGDHERMPAEGVAVLADDHAPLAFHQPGKLLQLGRGGLEAALGRRKAARARLGLAGPPARRGALHRGAGARFMAGRVFRKGLFSLN